MGSQIRQLLNGAPWNDTYARRPQEFYFHTRADLDADALDALDDWTNFVAGDSCAFWNTYHWLTFDGSPNSPELVRKMQRKRTNIHAVFRKKATALLAR
ncbi:hypothetical protein V7S43_004379 [Phytophthora oleae]|uniref:Uncharacterized protein n=1 Tax=Phytophthora oleae TaxID=2107226 RepID=A0ABD3EYX6_9STRA